MSSSRPASASLLLCALFLAAQLPGCGPSTVVNSPEIYNTATLEEVGDLIRSTTGGNKRPPASLQDLAKNRDLFMNGYKALEQGNVIANWGVAMVPGDDPSGSEEIIAYQSDVPTKGGPVLMKNGTVKTMSADQFKAAPKASK